MGIYLPMEVTLLVPVGALIGWLYNRWADRARQPRLCRTAGHADGDRPDCRRKPDGRGLCRDRRAAEKAGSADSANVLALVAAYPQVMLVERSGVRAGDRRPLRLDQARAAVPPVPGDRIAAGRSGDPLAQPRPRYGATPWSGSHRPSGGGPLCQKTSIGMPPRGYQ